MHTFDSGEASDGLFPFHVSPKHHDHDVGTTTDEDEVDHIGDREISHCIGPYMWQEECSCLHICEFFCMLAGALGTLCEWGVFIYGAS